VESEERFSFCMRSTCGSDTERRAECEKEKDGEERHSSIWTELKTKAKKSIAERDRKVELARIEKRKNEISKLLAAKRYADVIAECDKETGANAGARTEDSKIWLNLKNQAKTEKDKIDRAAEEKRIAAKLERVNQLLAERKFAEVVSLCDEERGQNAGSRTEDLAQWKSIRAKALADDLLSKVAERSKATFCIKGFYLGMTLEEAEILLDYYFPEVGRKRVGDQIKIGNRAMCFCDAEGGRVVRLNFDKKMLAKWFDYEYQSYRDWVVQYVKEFGFEFKTCVVQGNMSLGDYGDIEFAQEAYQYRNRKLKYRLTYFGEESDDDHKRKIRQAAKRAMIDKKDYSLQGFAAEIWESDFIAGFSSAATEDYNKQRVGFLCTKGADEGTLRVECLKE